MNDKTASLRSTFSVNGEAANDDTRFLKVVIDILHVGENLNGSYFSKEVVDECIESIKNTPVLGFIKKGELGNEDDFKGHEYLIKRTENGVEEVYIGSCYGIIPESCNPRWINKICSDGVTREFMQVDALMWEKFTDATNILKRDGEKSQSMELEVSSVEGYEDENDGLFHFAKFRFDGACLLGEGVQPAMVDSVVSVDNGVNFTLSDVSEGIRSELKYNLELFNKIFTESESNDVKNNQGGVGSMSDMNKDFAQTVVEQLDDIKNIVSAHATYRNIWGEVQSRFKLADVQDSEVIVFDKDKKIMIGFPFTVNGDKPEIDFACGGKRKKVRYEDYVDGSSSAASTFDIGEYISEIEEFAKKKGCKSDKKFEDEEKKVKELEDKLAEKDAKIAELEDEIATLKEKIKELEGKGGDKPKEEKSDEKAKTSDKMAAEFAELQAKYDEIKPKYDAYVEAEQKRIFEEVEAQKDVKFAEFESELGGEADFIALKEKKSEMSLEDIEKECAFMYVKVSRAKNKFSATEPVAATVGVISDGKADEADGLVYTSRYGYIHSSK